MDAVEAKQFVDFTVDAEDTATAQEQVLNAAPRCVLNPLGLYDFPRD